MPNRARSMRCAFAPQTEQRMGRTPSACGGLAMDRPRLDKVDALGNACPAGGGSQLFSRSSACADRTRVTVQEWFATSSAADPLWQSYAYELLNDTDEGHLHGEPHIMEKNIAELLDHKGWYNIGEQVGLSRWFQFVPAAKMFNQMWHRRLILQIFIGLKQGWLTTNQRTMAELKFKALGKGVQNIW